MPRPRDPEFVERVGELIGAGKTNPEIAEELGKTRASIAIIAQREFGGNPNYRKRMIKYDKRFTLLFVKYYQNHTHKECAEKFGITPQEVKSILAGCYKKSQPYKDIRRKFTKDKRRKDKWTPEQIKKMLSMIGLLPREEIEKRIGRKSSVGGRVVKEKLRDVGIEGPKYINGLTLSRFREVFGCEPGLFIKTKAGPGRGKYEATFFRIVPWVYIEEAISWGELNPPQAIKTWVSAMADFQRFVHGPNVYGSLQKIIPVEEWEIQ